MNILVVEKTPIISESLRLNQDEHFWNVVGMNKPLSHDAVQVIVDYQFLIIDVDFVQDMAFNLISLLRKMDSEIPVILVSNSAEVHDRLRGFEAGADDYMVKPVVIKELIVRMQVLIRRIQGYHSKNTLLKVDDLELSTLDKRVVRNGNEIKLTPKEYMLLEYFLRNKNRVVSRAEISHNVWNMSFDSGTNMVDVYINYLRNKIDKGFSYKLIHTINGMGYMIRSGNTPS